MERDIFLNNNLYNIFGFSSQKMYSCNICHCFFHERLSLFFHFINKHHSPFFYSSDFNLKEENSYYCNSCKRNYASLSSLKNHMRTIHNEKYKKEDHYQKLLQERLQAKKERIKNIGEADLYNGKILAEIKNKKNWKHALGQIIVYSKFLKAERNIIFLFNNKEGENELNQLIRFVCSKRNIEVLFLK